VTFPAVACYTYISDVSSFIGRHEDMCAAQYKAAIKGEPFNGYAPLPRPDNPSSYWRLTTENADEALTHFGPLAAAALVEHGIDGPALLVPMPCSRCIRNSELQPRTVRLAEELARAAPSFTVSDCVRMIVETLSTRSGGSRDPAAIFRNLTWKRGAVIPAGRVVVVDDVLTSGGHLRALAAFLEASGATVIGAICAVRASHTPADAPLRSSVQPLERFTPPPF
jgi:hypothetical protein